MASCNNLHVRRTDLHYITSIGNSMVSSSSIYIETVRLQVKPFRRGLSAAWRGLVSTEEEVSEY